MGKANAHNNLGVTLLRMGNSRDAESARRLYYQALTNFQSSLQQGNGGAQGNIDAIHQNCKIRYNTNCGEAFAAFTGGVGVFSSDDDEDDWEDSDEDDWGDDEDEWATCCLSMRFLGTLGFDGLATVRDGKSVD